LRAEARTDSGVPLNFHKIISRLQRGDPSTAEAARIIPPQTVAGQIPSAGAASSLPGQGGIVTPTASIASAPSQRN
jgi:hypothetical protein